MKVMKLCLGVVTVHVLMLAGQVFAEPLPVETMFRRAQYHGAVLSPRGNYVAVATATGGQRYNVVVIDLGTRKPQLITAFTDGDVTRIRWLTDDRLLVYVGDLQVGTGDRPGERAVVAIDRDGRNPYYLSQEFNSMPAFAFADGTSSVVVGVRGRPGKTGMDIYRVDTKTKEAKLLNFEAPPHAVYYVVDLDGAPRAAVSYDREYDKAALHVRRHDVGSWKKVDEQPIGLLKTWPRVFGADRDIVYVASYRSGDRAAVYEYNIATGAWDGPVVKHPARDVDGTFLFDLESRRLLGLRYADEKPSTVWFEAEWMKMQRTVDAALPNRINHIDKGGNRWLIESSSDVNPGELYVLDGKTLRLERLLTYRPWLDPRQMATTRWVQYKSADGLTIPALLTMPKGQEGKRNPLVVLLPPGFLASATEWGFQQDVQFLASRGYAVLQPQVRGTRGFGWTFYEAGFRKFGEEPQNDVEDGVKWAVDQGIADAKRVCFMGTRYGGHAALLGASKSPGLINCAVARSAIVSLDWIYVHGSRRDDTEARSVMIGTDRERLRRTSALGNVDKVGVPVLLAYGSFDTDLHGEDFRSGLQRGDKPHEWVMYDEDQGSGFQLDKNTFDFYSRVERFLAKHLAAEAARR